MTSKYARERLSWNGWGWVDERFELSAAALTGAAELPRELQLLVSSL